MQHQAIINSPLGKLGIKVAAQQLLQLDYLTARTALLTPQTDFAKQVVLQLQEYFNNPTFIFSLAINFQGTAYQQSVWRALQKIPYGKTLTYGELAQQLQSGPRAVGNACRRNLIPIIVPCHRIIAANHIGGYSGHTEGEVLDIKKWLLRHEGSLA